MFILSTSQEKKYSLAEVEKYGSILTRLTNGNEHAARL